MDGMEHSTVGLGVYTLQEASLYAQISSRKLSRWVFGSGQHSPVFDSQLYADRLVSFYDMVQAMAVDRARAKGIPLRKVRLAIERAQADYNIPLPLAYRHILYFDRELHIQLDGQRIVELSGPVRGQTMMEKIMEPFMELLCFDEKGLAQTYMPFEKYGRRIILNPKRQFGQPIVEGVGYRADILANVCRIEGPEAVMEEFNVESDDVNIAVDYMNSLKAVA
jgi:uncharacterized protein (DUF433 family)